ncbi:MAG: hypothetical protein NT023_04595 [Armatimonadetes bacterium]|nr:hypothetical protein [Armatimonadota bacterium]
MPLFALSVWRPIRHNRTLFYKGQSALQECLDISPKENLYEQIFTWSPREDFWGAITDDIFRRKIQEFFDSSFISDKDPSERGIHKLEEFITLLSEGVGDTTPRLMPSLTTKVNDEFSEATPFFPILALLGHLRWIAETYQDAPNVTVMVR